MELLEILDQIKYSSEEIASKIRSIEKIKKDLHLWVGKPKHKTRISAINFINKELDKEIIVLNTYIDKYKNNNYEQKL